jgi:hypothetical protein
MKKMSISILLLLLSITAIAQNFMEITFNKEISHNDTCIRFYNVKNFDITDTNIWEYVLENLYNIVLITPSKREIGDTDTDPEYYSICDNVLFYCIYGYVDNNLLNFEGLNDAIIQKKIICKFNYNNGILIKCWNVSN